MEHSSLSHTTMDPPTTQQTRHRQHRPHHEQDRDSQTRRSELRYKPMRRKPSESSRLKTSPVSCRSKSTLSTQSTNSHSRASSRQSQDPPEEIHLCPSNVKNMGDAKGRRATHDKSSSSSLHHSSSSRAREKIPTYEKTRSTAAAAAAGKHEARVRRRGRKQDVPLSKSFKKQRSFDGSDSFDKKTSSKSQNNLNDDHVKEALTSSFHTRKASNETMSKPAPQLPRCQGKESYNSIIKEYESHLKAIDMIRIPHQTDHDTCSILTTLSNNSRTTASEDASCFNAIENKKHGSINDDTTCFDAMENKDCSTYAYVIIPPHLREALQEKPPLSFITSSSSASTIDNDNDCDGLSTPPTLSPPSSPPPAPKGRIKVDLKNIHHYAKSFDSNGNFVESSVLKNEHQHHHQRHATIPSFSNNGTPITTAPKSSKKKETSFGINIKVLHKSLKEERNNQNLATCKQIQLMLKRLLQEQQIACEAWDEVASEYHRRVEPFTSMFVPHLLDPCHLVMDDNDASRSEIDHYYLKGKSVLDVAAGTGAAALFAASRGASLVTATDFSEKMLEVIQRRIVAVPLDEECRFSNMGGGDFSAGGVRDDAGVVFGEEGQGNFNHCNYPCHPSNVVETRLADGLCLPAEWKNQYDIVCSNFGVIFLPNVSQGLSEMVKCAKPGTGKVCISGWGSSEETQAFSIFPVAMKRCGFDSKWFKAQSMARKDMLDLSGIPMGSELETLHSSDRRERRRHKRNQRGVSLTPNYLCPTKRIASGHSLLHSLMTDAGLEDVKVIGPVTHDLRINNAEDYWRRFVLASPNLKRVVDQCLNKEEVMQLKKAVFQLLHENACSCDGEAIPTSHRKKGIVLQSSSYIAFGTKI